MNNCNFCGAPLDDDALFCANCGKKVENQDKRCPKCGTVVMDDSVFCAKCGARLDEQVVTPIESSQIVPPVMPLQEEEEVIYDWDKDEKARKWKIVIWSIVLIVIISAGGYYIYKNYNKSGNHSINEQLGREPIALKGSINETIVFSMKIHFNGNEVEGSEHYDNQKAGDTISIKGTIDENSYLILHEYDKAVECGKFEGFLHENSYSGTFTNSKGKNMQFSATVLTVSEFSKVEEEKKRFETAKIVYKKNTSSANVKLSVDYPIKGTDALLQNTRRYVSGVIAAMFNINEYKGNLDNGNTVINTYGKTKYDELDKEWKENAYEGTSAYEESIDFKVDYENDYCVSLCAHSYYFHGGVSNAFCDASTFRKVDGKHITIINTNNSKGLNKLVIDAVKNRLGEDYEYINEEFESSPVAGIIHLVKSGVQFDYQHYEIGPGYFGQVSITIPYEKIKPYMTKEAINVLEI